MPPLPETSSSPSCPRPRSLPGPWLVVAATFGVRLLYLADIAGGEFFTAPVVDAHRFVEHARAMASGQWLGGEEVFWHPPLYTYLLALVMSAVPEPGFYLAARGVQVLLATASALLLFRLAQRCVALGGAPRWAPLASGIAYAVWGPLVYFDGELLSVSLEVFLYLLLLDRCDRLLAVRTRAGAVVAGWVAGLAAITRPNILLFVVLAGTGWLLRHRHLRRLAPWFLLPLVLVIGVTAARNFVVGGDLVAISANGGINFFIGNNAAHDSTVAIRPGSHWEDLIAEPRDAGLVLPSERSAYFLRKAGDFITAEPVSWLRLLATKTYQLFSGPEIKRNVDVYYGRSQSPLLSSLLWSRGLSFPFGLLSPLALIGLWSSRHRRDRCLRLLRCFVAGYGLSIVLFFVTSRYRAPLVPVLLIFGCYGLDAILRSWQQGNRRRWGTTSAALVLTLVLNLPAASDPAIDPQLFHDRAEIALRRGDWPRARELSSRAIALDAGYASAFHNRAVAALHLQQFAAATADARAALELNPRLARAHVVLARVAARQGRDDEARTHLQRALQIDGSLAEAHYDLGRLLARAGRLQESLPHLRAAHRSLQSDFWAHYEFGRVLLALGQADSAIAVLRVALDVSRQSEGYNVLAAAYLHAGRIVPAIAALDTALQLRPRDVHALTNRGRAELMASRPGAAIPWFRRALKQRPEFVPARRGLQEAIAARAAAGRS